MRNPMVMEGETISYQKETSMHSLLAVLFLVQLVYLLVRFERQDNVLDDYQHAVYDVESRLSWACSRSSFPFGMKAQMDVSRKLLGQAKNLWRQNRWHQAYRVALQSQEAMNRAQSIYSSFIRCR